MGIINFTGTELKNLFSKPATVKYPFAPREYKERTRGHVENDMEACVLCGLCQMKCPTHAITVDKQKQTWSIRPFSCIQCRSCVDNCPKKSLSMENTYQEPGDMMITQTFELSDKQKEALAAQAKAAAERAAAAMAAKKAAEAAAAAPEVSPASGTEPENK